MPTLRTYRVFISHCWEYGNDYRTLVRWLSEELLFRWKDLSVSDQAPMREDKTFEKRLRKRLTQADIMIIVVGMEISHRYWMSLEIKWARICGVPLWGVMPNGLSRVPKVVQDAKCPIVGWRRDSIIPAVRLLAREPR